MSPYVFALLDITFARIRGITRIKMKNRFSHVSVLFSFKTTLALSSFSETVKNAEFVFFFEIGTSLSCAPLKISL